MGMTWYVFLILPHFRMSLTKVWSSTHVSQASTLEVRNAVLYYTTTFILPPSLPPSQNLPSSLTSQGLLLSPVWGMSPVQVWHVHVHVGNVTYMGSNQTKGSILILTDPECSILILAGQYTDINRTVYCSIHSLAVCIDIAPPPSPLQFLKWVHLSVSLDLVWTWWSETSHSTKSSWWSCLGQLWIFQTNAKLTSNTCGL